MQLETGSVLRDYEIEKFLGKGGMGTVYLAKDSFLDRSVAIKELSPLLTADAELIERFCNEARLQAKLVHPNIVNLYHFLEQNGRYYIVMEYAEGRTLKEIIGQTGPIPEARAISILKQVVSALEYAHGKNIIHRDIKPSNIVLGENDKVKVLDFGIAKIIGEQGLTQTGQQLGSLAYMSPEQVRAEKDIDGKTDVYSLGVTLYTMLSGCMPYDLNFDNEFDIKNKILEDPLPDLPKHCLHVSDNTVKLLAFMTEKDRNKRFSTDKITSYIEDQSSWSIIQKPTDYKKKTYVENTDMVLVDGGNFMMGSSYGKDEEEPYHEVIISSFLISRYQVTQEQWNNIMNKNPSNFKGDSLPVEQVSWCDAIKYCNKLSIKEGLMPCYSGSGDNIICNWEANGYRLPTEAEWEYAARGGQKSADNMYAGSDVLKEVAWFNDNLGDRTQFVGKKNPNELGIYDMSGNVWEWCWDWYSETYYKESSKINPRGPSVGAYRVLRGGSWVSYEQYCRNASRYQLNPRRVLFTVGFRLATNLK
ncbi:MAG: bifunctional serine/threonine-protein kinase/formylglycine-generating enzyme family protein [Candidatus Cloacimonadaceae bacterium]